MGLTAIEISTKYNVDVSEVREALSRLKQGRAVVFAMSGKMGSGKDTVGDLISKDERFSKFDIIQTSYATPLREEISDIVRKLEFGVPIEKLSEDYNVTIHNIDRLTQLLKGNSIFQRTPEARLAIQYWGTDVRRKQNPNYWVNKIVEHIIKEINYGRSVYVTDVRFPNEADSILDIGGKVIRLSVPWKTRVDRIMFRDGATPTKEQLEHKSETGLDEYKFEATYDGEAAPELLAKDIANHLLK